jgi:glycine hydroxymethyltransferase
MEDALGKVHITVNKNTVPNENRSPFVTSGVRMGTPALTSRGMGAAEMQQIAGWVRETFDNFKDEAKLQAVAADVIQLSRRFPLYPQWKG